MSQRRRNTSNANENENSIDAIKECLRYIFYREGSKIPLKRSEIMKHLTSVCQTPGNQINDVIREANNLLKQVYGYKLVQVDANSGIQYIVVLNKECSQNVLPPTCDPLHRRLLVAALTHIFMNGGPVREEKMWKFLEEAGLLDENDHGNRKILTVTFIRQMYLSYTKEGEGDLARNVFDWGQRAAEEVPKMFLLTKMAEGFEKPHDHWCEQYKVARAEIENEPE